VPISIPKDWQDIVIGIGYIYKFSPNDIWEMTVKELLFWFDGIRRVNKWLA
jgi:hypothetical protein